MAHNELGHEPVEAEDYDGKTVRNCPLYPGMTCREHCDVAVDADAARDPELIKVPFIELHPNSWLVPPIGEVEQISEDDQFVAKKVQAAIAALQKKLGPALDVDTYGKIRALLVQAETAGDDDEWRRALQALAGIEKLAPKPSASLRTLITARLESVLESVQFAYEDAIQVGARDDTPMKERIATVEGLVAAVDVAIYGQRPPLLATMRAWLARQAQTTSGGK